jgi:phenylalanyl-tRNA synthetase alpha chain
MQAISTEELDSFRERCLSELKKASDLEMLEAVRVGLLGRKGAVTQRLHALRSLPEEQRRHTGAVLNAIKGELQEAIALRRVELESQAIQESLQEAALDVTLPGRGGGVGVNHPVRTTLWRITDYFLSRGFVLAEGPEVEDDFHNFAALNMPADHPARAMHDTFYLENGLVLRTHTSPVQVRYLEHHGSPARIIAAGRVFRRDSDLTHTPMFHQVEGLVVDQQASMADLFGELEVFLQHFFEDENLAVRFRPSYFPFTEPSAEVDVRCVACGGKGCRICKNSGWLEVLGCGMVHPNVLSHVGLDAEQHQGYAFGLGVERLAMLAYAVSDLRAFYENDLMFLGSFR